MLKDSWHQVRMVSDMRMCSIYVQKDMLGGLPGECYVLEVTPLLRELAAAVAVDVSCASASCDERVMMLVRDEIRRIRILLLPLPQPSSVALCLCATCGWPNGRRARCGRMGA
ncbi:hypothetical protein [Chromobacterium sp. CV08]|uniref:hypothetical protein n=1 Tax=Chromobacterium sp. CV08 TaxID=3133274 RepID=UPI003DA92D4C